MEVLEQVKNMMAGLAKELNSSVRVEINFHVESPCRYWRSTMERFQISAEDYDHIAAATLTELLNTKASDFVKKDASE